MTIFDVCERLNALVSDGNSDDDLANSFQEANPLRNKIPGIGSDIVWAMTESECLIVNGISRQWRVERIDSYERQVESLYHGE